MSMVDFPEHPKIEKKAAVDAFAIMQNMLAIFVILVFLGFPGRLNKIIGDSICTLIEYGSMGIQFMLVTMASGNDVMSIKLINIKPAYYVLYIFLAVVCVMSMYVTIDKKLEMITLVHFVLTILFAIWLVERYTAKELMELTYYAQFIFFSLTVICIVVFPNIAFYKLEGVRTIGGLFKTKNEFGTQLAFGILVQCILLRMRLQNRERVSVAFFVVLLGQFGLMLLSKNFGAILIVFAFAAYIVLYGKSKNKTRLPLGMLFTVITLGFLVFALTVLQWMEPILAAVGKSVTLTGRVPLWQNCITVMTESHTFTGYGYEMFWRTNSAVNAFHSLFPENSWAATTSSSMHNSIMELWINIGLIGVALYYVVYLYAEEGAKYIDENPYLFCSAYMVMFAIRALTERQNDPGTFYVLFQYVVICIMLQGKYEHRMKKLKKARIYEQAKDEDSPVKRVDKSDLASFQKRFSNIADSNLSERRRPPVSNIPSRRRSAFVEPEVKENKLESLLREFDDDDDE